ncbi:hypothetical protein PG993_002554 [Apiospora rasikravindrae]|uniref:SMP-30/Gluconolactonase/LRE-like region domain-containing protein n=1 Tax=Apiospora rasikravindrae TaxID=990691 RepID=A0ABR1TZP4_9PEZI
MESPTGLLYTLDPRAAAPQARLQLYAVSGGLHTSFAFEKGSMAVHIVSVTDGKVVDSIPVPDTATMNGMASLPHHPHILLSADSIDGRILSIDTQKRKADVLLKHDMLAAGAANNNDTSSYPVPPIGINGLRVRGDYLYFTNSNQGTFVRVRIDEYGRRTGNFEVLARSPDAAHIYDDFTFDQAGNAYIATHSSSVFKVTPRGVQTLLVGDSSKYAQLLAEPTSATLALDGKCIYVSNGGDFMSSPRKGGQILQIPI